MALSPITDFALAARAHDDVLDLERLAVGIARIGNPALDATTVALELDRLAVTIADDVHPGLPPDRLALQLRSAMVGRLGFTGDRDGPRDAVDSYLDRVIERRRGLPILLSVVWILLGQRLGVPIAGVNYPGHFLVCLDLPGAWIYLDPFHGGVTREAGELLARLGSRAGAVRGEGGASPLRSAGERSLLEPCGVRAIVARILTNLKNLWIDQPDYVGALAAVDRILLIQGEVPSELRDRGLICLHLGRPTEAARDFRRYLQITPEAEDRSVVEALLVKIQEA